MDGDSYDDKLANVFIFNFIKNNEKDIALLVETFTSEEFGCRTMVFSNLNYNDIKEKIARIANQEQLVFFNYVVIIVLDNKNVYKHCLSITDNNGDYFYLNAELLNQFYGNKSIKKLFHLIQKNNHQSDSQYKPYMKQDANFNFYAIPTTTLNATSTRKLKDYWPEPNAEVSPFIKSFCKYFKKYGSKKDMAYIYEKMCKYLEKVDGERPDISIPAHEFGQSLSQKSMQDYG